MQLHNLVIAKSGGYRSSQVVLFTICVRNSINVVIPKSAKSKIDKFSVANIASWGKLQNKQDHSKVMRNGFPANSQTFTLKAVVVYTIE